jgi:hypothetical protein
MSAWLDFAGIILVQLCFFGVVGYSKGSLNTVRVRRVAALVLLGGCFGTVFDLVVGKIFGVFNYDLGFGLLFLVVNGILSYGLMLLTITIFGRETRVRFYVWAAFLGCIYECGNVLFPVWHWTFIRGNVPLQESVVVLILYPALAFFMAILLRFFFGVEFRILR